MNLYLGLDFGTSGARGVVIDSNFQLKAQTQYVWQNAQSNKLPDVWQNADSNKLPDVWQKALFRLLNNIPEKN
jgi:sugar (pentulose or hexulose) kinase